MAAKLLGGLFDRPLTPNIPIPTRATTRPAADEPSPGGDGGEPDPGDGGGGGSPPPGEDNPIGAYCPPGSVMDITGYCIPLSGTGAPVVVTIPPSGGPISVTPVEGDIGDVNIQNNIDNTIAVTDTGIQSVADAVSGAIANAASTAATIARQAASQVAGALSNIATNITSGIAAALGNIGSVITGIASVVWNNLQNIVQAIGSSVSDLISKAVTFLQPILANIASVLDNLTQTVQNLYDNVIYPLLNFYQTTVSTIGALTVAIEQDLKTGISGLLALPGQLVDALGSIDATLDRTVQQLGTINGTTVSSGITFAGQTLPQPFGDAMAASLGGSVLSSSIKTTFGGNVPISNESLAAVSAEAISGLGTLLSDVLNTITKTYSGTFDQLHADWTDVGSVFVGLLDGLLSLLTTATAIGALTLPLIDAAEQQARILVPTRKLDPATVVAAMQRGFLTSQAGLAEISTSGLDPTRTQVLIDLNVFLADVNQALDWWYRGIINDQDLSSNMSAHGVTDSDQVAIKAGSVYLPSIGDLLRWTNFGIISEDELAANMAILRYDQAQVQAVLSSYQQHETPEILSQLDGLLNNSSIGWISNTLNTPVPQPVSTAGQRMGYHPDLTKYIWLSHWELPPVDTFIESYFRGYRTLTEVNARLAMANIPSELWNEVVQDRRPLIPFFFLASYIKSGTLTVEQGLAEFAKLGYDEQHLALFEAAFTPKASTVTATAAATVHTLSIANARELWGEGALTDEQYTGILEAHGYTSPMAALQLQADAISVHLKTQKQTLTDYTAQVEAGILSMDDAIQQLTQQGFTSAQVAKFQVTVNKALAVAVKHPSLSQLLAFVKAGYITVTQYTTELISQGWTDPWLTAFTLTAQSDAPTSTATP